jgi:gluconolactonase
MKKIAFLLFLSVQFCMVYSQGSNTEIGTIEFISNELESIIKRDAKVEVVADGFQFTEGPVWVEKEKMLLLSDVPGNIVYKWTEAGGKEVYLNPGGYTDTVKRGGFMGPNGLIISDDGKLLICQHGDRRIAVMDASLNAPKPVYKTLVGSYNGKRLNSPNDLFQAKNGDIYFTDPSYGFERGANDPKKELSFQGVYKVDKAGKVTLLVDSIEAPNGIGIFPDGKTILISNSDNQKKRWYTYEIAANGSLTNGKIFYDVSAERGQGGCDGFKIDAQGNVFAAGPGGIWIFTKEGKLIGKIKMNGTSVANCALMR